MAVLLFVLGVTRALPVVSREVQGAADLLPSRFKGGWPQRAAARRSERAQAAASAGTRHGSGVCAAVGVGVTAAVHAVTSVAAKAVGAAGSGVAAAADALPSRFKGAWSKRAMQLKGGRRMTAEASSSVACEFC